MTKEYIMSQHVATRLRGRGVEVSCAVCGRPIKVDARVVSKNCGWHSQKTKRYHQECYQKMWI